MDRTLGGVLAEILAQPKILTEAFGQNLHEHSGVFNLYVRRAK